jgi:hypothetical protein
VHIGRPGSAGDDIATILCLPYGRGLINARVRVLPFDSAIGRELQDKRFENRYIGLSPETPDNDTSAVAGYLDSGYSIRVRISVCPDPCLPSGGQVVFLILSRSFSSPLFFCSSLLRKSAYGLSKRPTPDGFAARPKGQRGAIGFGLNPPYGSLQEKAKKKPQEKPLFHFKTVLCPSGQALISPILSLNIQKNSWPEIEFFSSDMQKPCQCPNLILRPYRLGLSNFMDTPP